MIVSNDSPEDNVYVGILKLYIGIRKTIYISSNDWLFSEYTLKNHMRAPVFPGLDTVTADDEKKPQKVEKKSGK